MTNAALQSLAVWFVEHCDGDWEHDRGITIESLDNPGWAVDVGIGGTELEGHWVDWTQSDRNDDDWLHWRSTGTMFEARCSANNLERAIESFLAFAQAVEQDRPIND